MVRSVLVGTDLLFTGPSVAMRDEAGLDSRAAPFDIPPMGLSLFRGAATGGEPGVRWFLDQVVHVMTTGIGP